MSGTANTTIQPFVETIFSGKSQEFTIAAGQTTFTTAFPLDSRVQVFLGSDLMVSTLYTQSGSTITSLDQWPEGEVVTIKQ